MTGVLTFQMIDRVRRHLKGYGEHGGTFGKFCIGVDTDGLPDLSAKGVWALEPEEVDWNSLANEGIFTEAAAMSDEQDNNAKFDLFRKKARYLREEILRRDMVANNVFLPVKSLVEDREAAYQ